ncbi:ZIP family metal transporter [Carboxydocella sp. ULO1]|uniref:ZIP family metal transporter n=1 Tax=Carboxydocella sp. ULO1 TaxID=1926599 RepID=UPI0009CC4DD8|nr:ZIP family metal transporter [Carboxydocella sp. ULO1]GAW29067.1 zinc/iron permease [Carboxydocella sp. ULO1]
MLLHLSMSLAAGLTITLGAILAYQISKPDQKLMAAFLGFAAGVMAALIGTDLLPEAMETAGWPRTIIGVCLGFLFLAGMDRIAHHTHGFDPEVEKEIASSKEPDCGCCIHLDHTNLNPVHLWKLGFLVALGTALHNLVEGLTVGVGFTVGEHLGEAILLAVVLHNIPIGMAIAVPWRLARQSLVKTIAMTSLVGLFTPLGTLLGLLADSLIARFDGFIMAVVAGTMIYIASLELIPKSYRNHPWYGAIGLVVGMFTIFIVHQH